MSRPATDRSADPTLPHTDLGAPAQMRADGRAAGLRLGLEDRLAAAARAAGRPAPSLHFDDHPTDQAKPRVEITEATARLARAIYGD